jgi:serine/threonine-protein kinase
MGAVYLGAQRGDAGFERPVAIKRTHAHLLGTPERRQLILQEASNASAVRHPNVVPIEDIEEIDDELLLVMPYVDGRSLSELIKAGRMPLGIVLSIVRDACSGLHAIHTALDPSGCPLGLLHRDISPQNILIGLDGVARIIDFGIAKSVRDPVRTSKQDRRGKFGYMAPEYLAFGTSTQSADIFAMGVVLWEALAGRRLWTGDFSPLSLKRLRDADVPLLAPEDDRIPVALDAVLQKALARTPEERFQTAAELGRALEEALPNVRGSRSDVAGRIAQLSARAPATSPPRAREAFVSVFDEETKPMPEGAQMRALIEASRLPTRIALRRHAAVVAAAILVGVTVGLTFECVRSHAESGEVRGPRAEARMSRNTP